MNAESLKLAEAPARLTDGAAGKLRPTSPGYGQGWAVIFLTNSTSARSGPLENAVAKLLPKP